MLDPEYVLEHHYSVYAGDHDRECVRIVRVHDDETIHEAMRRVIPGEQGKGEYVVIRRMEDPDG